MESDDKIDGSISKILETVQDVKEGLALERSKLTTEEVERLAQIRLETDRKNSVIWTNVFRWLDTKSLNRALVVCQTWNRIGNNPLLWKSTNLDSTKLTDKIISRVIGYQPTSLSLNKATFTRNDLYRLLSKLPDLEDLSVNESECSNLAVLRSCWCPKLTRLDMANVKDLTDDFVQSLFLRSILFRARHGDEIDFGCRLENLQFLGLAGTDITNETIKMLTERARSLRELDLSRCKQISNKGIEFLQLPNSSFVEKLTHLNISDCNTLTGTCERHLLNLSKLAVLNIRNTKIYVNDAVLKRFKKSLPDVQLLYNEKRRGNRRRNQNKNVN